MWSDIGLSNIFKNNRFNKKENKYSVACFVTRPEMQAPKR